MPPSARRSHAQGFSTVATNAPLHFSSTPEDSASVFDLRHYARLLLKRKWVILAVFALVVTGAVFWTLRQTKLYVATATIIIDPKAPEVLGGEVQEVVQMGSGGMWWNEDYYNTQVEILESRNLARMTVLQHDLQKNSKVVGEGAAAADEEARIKAATSVILRSLSIKQSDQNRIFQVRMTHKDPEIAAYLANAHVETYIQYNLNLRSEGTEFASEWLTDELDKAEKGLRNSELKLFEFKKENDMLSESLEDRANLVSSNIERYTTALEEAKMRRTEIENLRRRLREVAELDVLESPVFALTDSETGEELKKQYYEETKALTSLETDFGNKAPEYQKQKEKVENLYKALKREAQVATGAVERRYMTINETVAAYRKELDGYRQEAFNLEEKAIDYNPLARTEKNDEEKYNTLRDRLRSSDLISRLKTVNIRPLDAALVPQRSSFPRLDRNIALASVLGLVLGIGLALMLEFLDRTIKTAEDVQQHAGVAVLGIIPLLSEGKKGQLPPDVDLLVAREPTSRAAECCRQIRTNLLFMSADHNFETLVVSSPNPREGKSTTVMYLASTMAQSGQRVLIIDSDMRRPRLHRAMGLDRKAGLSNLIVGDASADEVIKSTDVQNLFFLPCGPTPPNPAELLMTSRFAEVLASLKTKFDRIILDSPPILAVTDALVMSKLADGVVLVIRAGETSSDDCRNASRQLRDVGARVAGVVLNELDVEDKSYGYYSHYYGYSYGRNDAGASDADAA